MSPDYTLLGRIETYFTSNNLNLNERLNLIKELYLSNSRHDSIIKNGLKLLDVGNEDKASLEKLLEEVTEIPEELKRIDKLRELYLKRLLSLSENSIFKKSKNDGDQVKYLSFELEYLLTLNFPFPLTGSQNIGNCFFKLGKVIGSRFQSNHHDSLKDLIQSSALQSLEYRLVHENPLGGHCQKAVALNFGKGNYLEWIFNGFIGAYDFYQASCPEQQADVVLTMAKLTKTRKEVGFYLENEPELKKTKSLLEERIEINDWNQVTPILFEHAQKVYLKLLTAIDESSKHDSSERKIGKGTAKTFNRLVSKYLESSQYLLKISPERVNFPELEKVIFGWKPSNMQEISYSINYLSVLFEIAKQKKDSSEKENWLRKAVDSAFLAIRDWRNSDKESYILIYSLLAQIKSYSSEFEISLQIENHPSLINYVLPSLNKNYPPVASALSKSDFFGAIIASLGDLSNLENNCVSKKGKKVFIPIDKTGLAAQDLVVKVETDFKKVTEEYFSDQEICKLLGDIYPRPLELRFDASGDGKRYLYFMKRKEGLDLTKRIKHFRSNYFTSTRTQNQPLKQKIKDEEFQMLLKGASSLARFNGILSNNINSNLEGEIEIIDSNGKIHTEQINVPINRFDYLGNLIERAFVKNNGSKSEGKVEKLKKIIQTEDYGSFSKLDFWDFFKSRIPYTPETFRFLCAYQMFVKKHLSSNSLEVILHGDAHLNNCMENGVIIDSKPLKRGNPLIDLTHLIENPLLSFMNSSDGKIKLRNYYFQELSSVMGKKIIPSELSYLAHTFHNSLCLIGAAWSQDKLKEVDKYHSQATRFLNDMILSQKGSSNYSELIQLRDLFEQMIVSTGRSSFYQDSKRFFWIYNLIGQKAPKMNSYNLKIGIDFDGVIADSTELKIEYAKNHYNLDLQPEQCTKHKAVASGMTTEQYEKMVSEIYSSNISQEAKPVKHAKGAIEDLIQEGCQVYIITSRNDKELEQAKKWLQKNHFPQIEIINTSNQPKDSIAKKLGLNLLIDDTLGKLEKINTSETSLYLFTNPQNIDVSVETLPLRRMDSWAEIYTIVNYHQEQLNSAGD